LIDAAAYGTVWKKPVTDVIREWKPVSEQIMLQQNAGAKVDSI
jgi:hypothetical protein